MQKIKLVLIFIILALISTNMYALQLETQINKSEQFIKKYFTGRWNCGSSVAYKTVPMVDKINGHDTIVWDMVNKIRYLKNESEQEPYKLKVIDNLLCDYRGTPLDSENVLFAMDCYGNILVCDKFKDGTNHIGHASFFACKDVASAGIMIIKDGVLEFIINDTGHYRVGFYNFIQVIDELIKKNYKFSDTHIVDYKSTLEITIKTKKENLISGINWERKHFMKEA